MHGSLLPKYRGRAPVNWAVIHGERETGATLARDEREARQRRHRRSVRGADPRRRHGPRRVRQGRRGGRDRAGAQPAAAARRQRPIHAAGPFAGRYFGGRAPEDGRIPDGASARQIHDLVRALAPPYPARSSCSADGASSSSGPSMPRRLPAHRAVGCGCSAMALRCGCWPPTAARCGCWPRAAKVTARCWTPPLREPLRLQRACLPTPDLIHRNRRGIPCSKF